jgi:PAS domain S-box-containing protein
MDTDLRRLLDALPGMVWTATPDGTCDFVSERWRDYTGVGLDALAAQGWISLFHPEDVPGAMNAWASTQALETPREINIVARMRRFDGVYRRLSLQTRPLFDADGQLAGWCGVNTDVEDRTRAEAQLAAEKRLLELVARGMDLPSILEALCVQVEGLSPDSLCSILFVDDEGDDGQRRFRVGAGPKLPEAYNAALDGLKVDPHYGPCSLAVETRSTVIAADPPGDPRWRSSSWPKLVTGFGLASCWSAPILGSHGEVLGIFAIYKRAPQGPTGQDEELIDRFARIAGVAIERAQADEALKAREAELRRVNRYLAGAQTLSRIGSFTLDTATGDQDWSEENYRIWEFDPAISPTMEMVAETIHPDDRERALAALGAATRKGEDFEVSYRIVTRSSAIKHLRTVAIRMPEIEDRVVFFGSSQDVTEDKLAEEALRASQAELVRANAHLTAAQRLSNTGSFTWDVLADDHHWSEVIYRVFGFEPGCKVSMDMMMAAIHPEDMADVQALIGGAANGENFELVFRIIQAGGELRHAHVMGHRIDQIPDHPVFMGALQDITARKLAEDDLNRARAELAHMSRAAALSTLTASIAHEVSQPLAGILANGGASSRMLAMDPPNLDGARAAIQRTIRDGQRASEVIKRLRAMFARRPPSLEPVDLHDAAREVLALSASELQRRRVIVRTDFAEVFPPVQADRIQLQQVILNLILNAVDAMETVDGRPRELRIASRRAGGQVMLDMRDVRQGIELDNIDQLFDAFHTTKPEGMGIGLSISRSIIEAHGGRLSATPNPDGSGATFSFSIPCDPSVVGRSTGHA